MKKTFLILVFSLFSSIAFSQVTVSYHHGSLPFIGINNQFGERFVPVFRLGTNDFLTDFDVELVANFLLMKKESVEIYGGLGGRVGDIDGLVIPIGLNAFPFARKDFGFHFELAPLVGDFDYLRGTFGIRYRFID